jgi:hypothetical protein
MPLFLLLGLILVPAASWAQDDDFLKEKPSPVSSGAASGGRQTVIYKTEDKKTAEGEDVLQASEIQYRGVFRMREIRTESDWDCDPTAIPAWCRQIKMRLGLESKWENPRQPVSLDNEEIFEAPLLYMTGHTAFSFSDQEVKNLRLYLLNGGLLFVDDCLYGFPFGRSFMSEIKRVLPEHGFESILPGQTRLDSIFGIHYRIAVSPAGIPSSGMGYFKQGVPLQAIRIQGRIAVLYSAYDLGCLAEISSPPTPANPLGGPMHGYYQSEREACYRLTTNILLFLLTH